jgi:hypothetical protein
VLALVRLYRVLEGHADTLQDMEFFYLSARRRCSWRWRPTLEVGGIEPLVLRMERLWWSWRVMLYLAGQPWTFFLVSECAQCPKY